MSQKSCQVLLLKMTFLFTDIIRVKNCLQNTTKISLQKKSKYETIKHNRGLPKKIPTVICMKAKRSEDTQPR